MFSPSQQILVKKGRLANDIKKETKYIKEYINHATKEYIQTQKQRYDYKISSKSSIQRDRALILRHVGKTLAKIAQKEEKIDNNNKIKNKVRYNSKSVESSKNNAIDTNEEEINHLNASEDIDGDDNCKRRPPRPQLPNYWASIYVQEENEVKEAKDADKKRNDAIRESLQTDLAQQQYEKQLKLQQEKENDEMFARMEKEDYMKWKRLEAQKEMEKQRINAKECQLQQEQLQENQKRYQEAQKRKEAAERRTIEQLKQLEKEELERKEQRKQELITEVNRVKESNALQQKYKQEKRIQEQKDEIRLHKAYEEKLRKREEERERELAEITRKQQHKVKMALLNVKSAEEQAKEDEIRALKVQKEYQLKEEAMAIERDIKKHEMIEKQFQTLTLQVQEQIQERQKEEQINTAFAEKFKADYQAFSISEQQKNQKKIEKAKKHQLLVKQQMIEDSIRRHHANKYGMTKQEMEIHAPILRNAGLHQFPLDAIAKIK